MGLVKLPFVLERFDVVCYESALGIKLCQLDSGAVVVLSFHGVSGRGEKGEVESSGKVQVGDALVCIDEMPIELLKYHEVLDRLRDAERPVTLTFGRTSEDVAQQVHDKVQAANMKMRQQNERTRLRELEVERRLKLEVEEEENGGGGSSSSNNRTSHRRNGGGSNNSKVSQQRARTYYTAKDFAASFKTFNRTALILFILLCLFMLAYLFEFDTSKIFVGERGMDETFQLHAVNKEMIDGKFVENEAKSAQLDHHMKDDVHVRPNLRKEKENDGNMEKKEEKMHFGENVNQKNRRRKRTENHS